MGGGAKDSSRCQLSSKTGICSQTVGCVQNFPIGDVNLSLTLTSKQSYIIFKALAKLWGDLLLNLDARKKYGLKFPPTEKEPLRVPFWNMTMLNLLGLVDAENVPVVVLHYSVPAVILLYFVFTSSIPRTPSAIPVVSPGIQVSNSTLPPNGTPTTPAVRRTQYRQSGLLKWLFVLAILTFVSITVQEFD